MKARHEGNQKLLEAIEHVIEHGPKDPEYRSCHNVQDQLDYLKGCRPGLGMQAYFASSAYCRHTGQDEGYPIETAMKSSTDWMRTGHWSGEAGKRRRAHLAGLRDFVKELENEVPDY